MAEIIDIFKNKQQSLEESVARTEPLSDAEIEAFKAVLLNSVASFCELSVMDKLSLYTSNVHLVITLIDLLEGKYVEKGEKTNET